MYKFKFADIGEGLHEGKVGEIYFKVGDNVKEGDSLFSVETDKVTSDIPSPVTGVVKEILIKTGETVHVGDDVFHFETEGDDAPAEAPKKEEPAKKAEAPQKTVAAQPAQPVQQVSSPVVSGSRKLSTPLARKLASKKGIDINQVNGSGINGRVLVADIENFSGSSASASVAKKPIIASGATSRVKASMIRKAVAKAMKNSWNSVAYTNLVTEVNMTSMWNTRKRTIARKDMVEKLGVKITFLPFIVKAVAIALNDFPNLNAKYDATTEEIVQFGDKNIGIAVDTPHGLFVPVIKNAEQKDLVTIAKEIIALSKKARDKKLAPTDMQGGTFSITNYGSVGAMYGVPVINHPEMAILGTGAIVDRVYADENNHFYNGKVMHLTAAADHQWVDGAEIGRFTMRVKEILENPILLLEELHV